MRLFVILAVLAVAGCSLLEGGSSIALGNAPDGGNPCGSGTTYYPDGGSYLPDAYQARYIPDAGQYPTQDGGQAPDGGLFPDPCYKDAGGYLPDAYIGNSDGGSYLPDAYH